MVKGAQSVATLVDAVSVDVVREAHSVIVREVDKAEALALAEDGLGVEVLALDPLVIFDLVPLAEGAEAVGVGDLVVPPALLARRFSALVAKTNASCCWCLQGEAKGGSLGG